MAKVNREEYGSQYPGLSASLINGDATALHIGNFEDITLRGRTVRVIEFREFPGQWLYLNTADIATLCDKINEDDDHWRDALVPLVKESVYSKRQRRNVDVLRVASAKEWDSMMEQFARAATAQSAKGKARR